MTAIHINRPRLEAAGNPVAYCPTCTVATVFWSSFHHWYGWTSTCSQCGDAWQDGEMMPRPYFCGPWREDAKRSAAARWWTAQLAEVPWDPPLPGVEVAP